MNAGADTEYTIVDATYGDTQESIPGIPAYRSDRYGLFKARYPYAAATKACTSIYQHMAKFPKWFPQYDKEKPPTLTILLWRPRDNKYYAYRAHRKVAPQSTSGPRLVVGDYGRKREYRWINILDKIRLEDITIRADEAPARPAHSTYQVPDLSQVDDSDSQLDQ